MSHCYATYIFVPSITTVTMVMLNIDYSRIIYMDAKIKSITNKLFNTVETYNLYHILYIDYTSVYSLYFIDMYVYKYMCRYHMNAYIYIYIYIYIYNTNYIQYHIYFIWLYKIQHYKTLPYLDMSNYSCFIDMFPINKIKNIMEYNNDRNLYYT